MTTLLLSEIFPPKTGGSGRWFWEIYSRLPREDFVIAAGEDPRQTEFDATHDLRVVRLPLTMSQWGLRSWQGLKGYGRALWQLKRLIRAEHITKIHCGRCLPEGFMALALRRWLGIPYICYVHGEDVRSASSSRELTMMVKRILRNADVLIVNSFNTAEILRSEWELDDEAIQVLHPGVDVTRFEPAPRDDQARRALGWGERPVVLTVGRLQLRKGHDQLIRALSVIRETVPDVLYSIVGDGEERARLEELVKSENVEDHVEFRGEPDDEELISCYQQCDLFVLPNREVDGDIEGFGIVLLEAQACGKPVVAGASGGTAETMCVGETGELVACDTSQPLAELVTELLVDQERRRQMGMAARQWVVEHFGWEGLSKLTARLFAEDGDSQSKTTHVATHS